MNGHIALHRKMFDNPVVCKDADHLAVWVYLLGMAVWSPTDVMFHGQRITLHPGQLTTGRKAIADKLKISESKVQRILKLFESEHQIEQRSDRQCRLITIVSWDKYQYSEQRVNNDFDTFEELDNANSPKSEQRVNNATQVNARGTATSRNKSEQRVNNDRTTSEQRVNTNKEYKNINKGINIYKDFPEQLQTALMDYEKMRKTIKKPMTDKARELLLKKLESMAGSDTDLKIKILEQSVMNSWQGVFPLNNQSTRSAKAVNPFTEMLKNGDY